MTGFPSRPDFYYGLAFNAAPNDSVNIPVWSEFTKQVRSISAMARGKQYELAQVMSSTPEVDIRDPDETLNMDNTGSPFYPNVVPYREALHVAQWPNYGGATPPSGQTNLLNLNVWQNPIDPTFESYSVGAQPRWITRTGVTNPGVVNANAHAGTKSYQFQVLNAPDLQTISWPLKCIPGRTYTSSVWFRQALAPITGVFPVVRGCTQVVDAFSRSVSSGWGTAAPFGGAWSTAGGAAADYSVATAGVGRHQMNTTGTTRLTYQGGGAIESNAACYVHLEGITIPKGAPVRVGVMGRVSVAGNTGYIVAADFRTDGTITLNIIKNVAGAETTLLTTNVPYIFDPTINYGMRIDVQGQQIQGKIWPETITEPAAYTMSLVDGSITTGGGVGCYSNAQSGNTNGAFHVLFDNFNATAGLVGTSTSTAGAYVQLSVTFTATQPDHAMTFSSTRSSGGTQTVNVDDPQHDQAGAVQAQCSTGPTIYPVMRNFAERFTRLYDETGFEGMASIPCVDALSALSAITIPVEYQAALNATVPLYSWPMNDAGGGASFAEVIQGGPSLVPVNGPNGPPTGALSPGAAISIPGYPGISGAQIIGNDAGSHGLSLVAPAGLVIPNDGSGTLSLTLAFWVAATDATGTTGYAALANKNGNAFGVARAGGGSNPFTYATLAAGGSMQTAQAPQNYRDGNAHLFVATLGQATGSGVVTEELYVDGALVSTITGSALINFLTSSPTFMFNSFQLSGGQTGGLYGQGVNATFAEVSIWARVLQAAEVANLYNAGRGFNGELTGARITRHLALGGYTGATRVANGTKPMGPPSYVPMIDLNTDTANTAAAEGGNFWIAPDGAVAFTSSDTRYLTTASAATFGESEPLGEAPYESGVKFDNDPTYIYASVQVARPQGVNAIGGMAADIAAANRNWFGRSVAITIDVQTDSLAQDLANWIFYTHNRPQTRVATVTLTPSANPKLWPFALGLEINNRITVIKRSKAANGGAGIVITQDYFIEQITHDGIDFDLSTWTTTFSVSPIGSATVGNGQTVQPWILGHATYGVLGSTTIPGY